MHITAIKQMVEASDYLIEKGKADVNIQDDVSTSVFHITKTHDPKTKPHATL